MAKKNNLKNQKKFSTDYQPKEKWTEASALSLGEDLILWLNKKDGDGEDCGNMFYEEFLIIENDFYPDLIPYLKGKFKSFSYLLEKAKKIQEIKLMKYGVGDRLNATMTKFTLINNHKWTERTESDVKVTDTNFSIKDIYKDEWDDEGEETQ